MLYLKWSIDHVHAVIQLIKHDKAHNKLPFGDCGAHSTAPEMRTFHARNCAPNSILNVSQLNQNHDVEPRPDLHTQSRISRIS